jgi:membrane protein
VGTSLGAYIRREARVIGLGAWRGLLELVNTSVLTHAASIAYFSLLSLFPFLLLLFSAIGSLTADPEVHEAVADFVLQYFPRQFEFITGQIQAFEGQTFTLGLGGAVALVWASLGVFNAVSSAVNHAWGVEKHRNFLAHRLLSFVMMVSAGLVLAVALVLASAIRVARAQWFSPVLERVPGLLWLSGVTAGYAATFLLVLCVALVFYFVPNTKVRFRDVWPGAIVTGLLWQVALSGFSWYTADLARWSVHGSIAAVVVFLFWVYICAAILIYGVEMTANYARLKAATERHPELVKDAI